MNTWLDYLHNFSAYLNSGQLHHLGNWAYLLIAALVAVEGPIATLLAAAAASAGLFHPILVFVFAAAGNLTADSLWYSLGRAGKLAWLDRFGRRLGIQPESLGQLQRSLDKHSLKILFVAKLTMSLIIPSLIAAGLMKIPWRRWFPAVLGGEVIWTGALVLIGYFATEVIKRVERGIEYLTLGVSVAFILFALWMGRRILSKRFKNPGVGSDTRN